MTENELRGEIRHCDNELKKFRHQIEKIQKKAMQVESKREACRNSLKDLENTPKNIEISNHAFVRYFERVLGFDLAKVSESILPDSLKDSIRGVGVKSFPVHREDGTLSHILKISGNTITTIYPPDGAR